MKQYKAIIAGVAVLAVPALCSAVLIDDFESYTVGEDPGLFGDGVTVETDTGANGSQILQQVVTSASEWTGSGIDFDPDVDGVNYGGNTVIRFDAYISSGYDGVVGVSAWSGINYTSFGDFQGMIRGNVSGDALDYRNGGSYVTIDAGIADVNEWHTYTFDMDYASDQYDIYVDGSLLIADAGMRQTGQSKSGSFRILGGYSDGSVMVDNVQVIPEPATFGLFGVFGGATLFIRRRLRK